MKTWWRIAGATAGSAIFGLLVTGIVLLISSQPRGEAIYLSPPPTTPPLIIHISGAVIQPGVYNLPQGSRLGDAVKAAGGFLPEADEQALNLAAFLQDGELIRIPVRPQPQDTLSVATPRQQNTQIFLEQITAAAAATATPTSKMININTASLEELDSLPGIGPVIAQKIISHRQELGPFNNIEAIQDVSGIGPAKFEDLKDLITISERGD